MIIHQFFVLLKFCTVFLCQELKIKPIFLLNPFVSLSALAETENDREREREYIYVYIRMTNYAANHFPYNHMPIRLNLMIYICVNEINPSLCNVYQLCQSLLVAETTTSSTDYYFRPSAFQIFNIFHAELFLLLGAQVYVNLYVHSWLVTIKNIN